ncbi:death domain-associated protein 6 [Melopsittacus undulatus]|uniref:death domain-associated protein 6 n=1 Tax=Melopsittacus undulatus TaxID=13146 RepID=UPI00146CE3F2|nr:death domain-associated protein 6 [Melopsittacus undulatus]
MRGPPPAPPTPPGSGDPPGTPPSGGGGREGGYKEENERLFGEFLALCTPLTSDHPEVLPFLCSRHHKTSSGFLASAELRNVLSRCLRRVRRRHAKVYVYINELCTTLKAHSLRRKLPLQPAPGPPPSAQPAPEPPPAPSSPPGAATGSKRQIRYLENLLRVYTGEIRRLQERELDLAELDSEDSAYLQESRLKRRMMRIFGRLCQLKRCSSLTGRVLEQRIPYRGTRYPEVNRRIERFINRPDAFPDYSDILKVIQKANARHRLGLARRHMESMAQDAFREVGNRLQERRHLDLVYNFGSHLTDQYRPGTDPALMDPELAKRLRRNRTMALSRLDQVISHYAQLQDESEEEERGRKRRRGTPGKSQPREEEEEEETEEETEEEEEEDEEEEGEEGDSSDGSHGKREEADEGDPMELNAPHGRDEDDEGATSKPIIPYGSPKGDPIELNTPHGSGEDDEGAASKPIIPYGSPKGDPIELNAPHGRDEDDEGAASKPSIPYGSPKGDPMELSAPHGKGGEDDEGATSKPIIPYGSPKGDPIELNAPHGRDEDDEGAASKPSIPYGSPKGDPMELNTPP